MDLSLFSFTVTQLNGSALGALKHHYFTKRIREIFIRNLRFLIYNWLNMAKQITFPEDTRHRFNVCKTSIRRQQRRIDVL